MMQRMLVAGIGNIFLGDDGFGVEVANRLEHESLPAWVCVRDFGIRGVHLAYELADGGYEIAILVDAASRGEAPGTVYLIEPDLAQPLAMAPVNAHSMTPDAVLETARMLGRISSRILVLGCEPASVEEAMGLSEPVKLAVDKAVQLVLTLIERHETLT